MKASGDDAAADRDYPLTAIPRHARKHFVSLAVVLLGFTVFTPTMLAGARLGNAFALQPLLLVIVAGSLLLTAYVAVIAWIGARTGRTTVLIARYSFGYRGAKLASILLGVTQVGWYAVVVGIAGDLTTRALGWDAPGAAAAVMVAVSALMCVTACYGYRGMYWVSVLSTPLTLILAFWVMGLALDEIGGWAALSAVEPTTDIAWTVAITTVVGTFVSAGTQAPNWTRFARTGTQAVLACVGAFFVGNGLMIFFGAVGAMTVGEGDFVVILYQLGLVFWGVVMLFGNLWKTNADTAYSFGLAGAELFERRTKTPFIVAGSAIATALALAGLHERLIDYLILLGVFIPPLGGVIIGDYFARWWRGMPDAAQLPAVNITNLVVYLLAGAAAWLSYQLGVGIPPLVGILVALVPAYLLGRAGARNRMAGARSTT